jgi:hypothetical protein
MATLLHPVPTGPKNSEQCQAEYGSFDMKRLLVYVDASVVGGCEDSEFSEGSLMLWQCFMEGHYRMALSELTLDELKGAPIHRAETY